MASIKKYPRRKYWYACYRDASGNQHTKSTHIVHSPEPKKPDDRKERARLVSQNKRMAQDHANRLEDLERGNPTEAHLRKVLSEMSERIRRERMEFPSTKKFLNNWLDNRKISDATLLRYRKSVNSFIESLEAKANLPIENITPEDINRYITYRFKDGLTPSTVSTDLKALNGPFNTALRQGIILTNPVAAADPVETAQETRHPFTKGEVGRLLQAAKGTDWVTAIHFAAFAGLRLGDAVNLRWSNIDLFGGNLLFRPKKTERKKVDMKIPLAKRILNYLKGLNIPTDTEAFLCPELAGKSSAGKSGLSMQFKTIMEKAKIERGTIEAEGEKARNFNRKSFHSLRHFFITRMVEMGIPEAQRMMLAGHSTSRIHRGYTHTEIEVLRHAVSEI